MIINIKGRTFSGRTTAAARLITPGTKTLVVTQDGDFVDRLVTIVGSLNLYAYSELTLLNTSQPNILDRMSEVLELVKQNEYFTIIIDSVDAVKQVDLSFLTQLINHVENNETSKTTLVLVEHQRIQGI